MHDWRKLTFFFFLCALEPVHGFVGPANHQGAQITQHSPLRENSIPNCWPSVECRTQLYSKPEKDQQLDEALADPVDEIVAEKTLRSRIIGDFNRDRVAFKELETLEVDRLFSNIQRTKQGTVERDEGSVLAATSLVAGTCVGAGILALPAATVSSGVIPSTTLLLGMWVYMVASGLLIAEVSLTRTLREGQTGLGLLVMAEKTLGRAGSRFAGTVYVGLHYCLLVAYMAQGGGIAAAGIRDLTSLPLPSWAGPVGFATAFGGLLALGSEKLVESVNNAFVAVVLLSFVGLLTVAVPGVRAERLLDQDWSQAYEMIPVMFVALVFHNIVPVIATQLEGNVSKVRQAILVGSAIPLVMFLMWNAVILGSLDQSLAEAAAGAAAAGGETFDPLALLRNGASGPVVGNLISVFSVFAIVTSFIGFVLGLLDFFTDAFSIQDKSKSNIIPLYGLILGPPSVIAVTDPTIFFRALDSAGTYGISVLFGIIPALMVWQQRYVDSGPTATTPLVPGGKITLAGMIIFAGAVIAQQFFEKSGFF
eukprot:CAMPEP_0113945110 /NCGR_PEP_ID=MMETSP1339-20121228/38489_1 /TAXON_ID=94617 /ORGANISM="Fibrocapsa japonica" /LENGTH=535 /DNA_ID=CAMNT_0000950519 /DNA_START=143 /DNA_END=1750 /DNA_ORIENTATION=+ /assembly_acc=CAM_ASM_000762